MQNYFLFLVVFNTNQPVPFIKHDSITRRECVYVTTPCKNEACTEALIPDQKFMEKHAMRLAGPGADNIAEYYWVNMNFEDIACSFVPDEQGERNSICRPAHSDVYRGAYGQLHGEQKTPHSYVEVTVFAVGVSAQPIESATRPTTPIRRGNTSYIDDSQRVDCTTTYQYWRASPL